MPAPRKLLPVLLHTPTDGDAIAASDIARRTIANETDQAEHKVEKTDTIEERGWFEDEQKQQPPVFPERVGVVTSLRGDARYDIQNAIHEQDPTVDILVKDVTVQGSEASTSIANGIHHLDRSEDVDAIIVGRGGGSDWNLQAFTTERVAEAIFTTKTPIVTAIGHTDDRLIADQVADVATITPTAAGWYIANSREEFLASEIEPLEQQLEAAYETTVSREAVRDELVSRLTHPPSLGGEVDQNDVDGAQDIFRVKPTREPRFQ